MGARWDPADSGGRIGNGACVVGVCGGFAHLHDAGVVAQPDADMWKRHPAGDVRRVP